MRIITRSDQNKLAYGQSYLELGDSYFDGLPISRTILPRTWIPEGSVHREKILSQGIESTRYFTGPQNCVVRDDNRRVTWVAFVESPPGKNGQPRLMLHKFPGSWPSSSPAAAPTSTCITEDDVWRYHIALNKFTGGITATWITKSDNEQKLWLDGEIVETKAQKPDFPFYVWSQAPIGHVATEEPPFSMFGYKCRKTGRLFIRRLESGKLGAEVELEVGDILGGISFGISGENVLARIDLLKNKKIIPALMTSSDSGKTFSKVKSINLSQYKNGFELVPGYTEPIVDVGRHFHVPIHLSNGKESVAFNYVAREDALTEAIRVDGSSRISNPLLENLALSQVSEEVFPATLGNPNAFGDGTTDGHGLIMVLSAEGRLFTSNSSAGGIFFPEAALLNQEMPLIAAFASTECYTSGLKPNFVSMDYIFIEADAVGRAISADLHFETWDMPLPIPQISAKSRGTKVHITALADMDFEAGQVGISFSDPSIEITDVKVPNLREAVVDTGSKKLKGKTVRVDVDSLFHRHYAEARIE